ncbi:MAG: 50S ribosomal protein L13 [Nitrospirae bacterium]|uniref:LSU ribosomal protein L13p (L13Ae) n=1 Tax=hydrothermal vent metagenome TaxID=652676 RepID=A0A3B1CAS7_9ZZZZ|nr:50S ribosomal protein L13 [Nitrospirota bacterium]NOY39301.1 50S ribosomal protein L13 [Nitrospirota bacterium]
MKTCFAKKGEFERKWYLVDASDKVLGRLATRIATYLRGKHKAQFTPNVDTGDFIVVVNAEKVTLTGKKLDDKIYYHHTGYPGGIKAETARKRLQRKPEAVIMDAVWGMLPKNRLGRAMLKKLKVYRGAEHPHESQQPETITL